MQPGVKVNGAYYLMSCCSNSCCQTSIKLLGTFAFVNVHNRPTAEFDAVENLGLVCIVSVWTWIGLDVLMFASRLC